MKQTFEQYLQMIHAKQYQGLDDEMPDDYEGWLMDLDKEDIIDYAEEWGKTLKV